MQYSRLLTYPSSLALAELYIVIASVFRRFDMELYDTVRERDVDAVRDCFIGETSPESRGVRVKIVEAYRSSLLAREK